MKDFVLIGICMVLLTALVGSCAGAILPVTSSAAVAAVPPPQITPAQETIRGIASSMTFTEALRTVSPEIVQAHTATTVTVVSGGDVVVIPREDFIQIVQMILDHDAGMTGDALDTVEHIAISGDVAQGAQSVAGLGLLCAVGVVCLVVGAWAISRSSDGGYAGSGVPNGRGRRE